MSRKYNVTLAIGDRQRLPLPIPPPDLCTVTTRRQRRARVEFYRLWTLTEVTEQFFNCVRFRWWGPTPGTFRNSCSPRGSARAWILLTIIGSGLIVEHELFYTQPNKYQFSHIGVSFRFDKKLFFVVQWSIPGAGKLKSPNRNPPIMEYRQYYLCYPQSIVHYIEGAGQLTDINISLNDVYMTPACQPQ